MTPKRFIAVVSPVAIVSTLTWFGVFTLVNAYMVKGLGLGDEVWAAATLWLSGGMLFWLVVSSEVSAWLGRRRTVTASLLAAGFGYAVVAFAERPLVIGPMLALMAFSQAAISVVFVSLLAHAGGERPGRNLALFQWLVSAATVLCLISGGYFIELGRYRETFLVIALLCGAAAAAFHALSRPLDATGQDAVVSLRRVSREDWRTLFRGPFVRVLLLGVSAEPLYFHMVNQLFPNLARNSFGFGEERIATLVALGRLPSLLTLFVLAHHIDRWRAARVYATAMMVSAAATLAIAWSGAPWALVAAYLVYYLCHGAVWGSSTAAVNSTVPPRLREPAFAILSIFQTFSVFVVGLAQQRMLAHDWSIPWVFAACAPAAIALAAALWIVAPSRAKLPLPS